MTQEQSEKLNMTQEQEQSEKQKEQFFTPPLWRQRRVFASQTIKSNPKIHSVFDIGCGEGALIEILLNDTRYNKVGGLDIDINALNQAQVNCTPTLMDKQYLRELPVQVTLFYGSLLQIDARIQEYDCITMLEVIEHLDEDVLDKVPKVVFEKYRPMTVIISTPNAEFNVNFPNLKYGTPEQEFRHWDHRFEWTRQEFQDWYMLLMRCNEICKEYNYQVVFDGVGVIDDTQTCGTCSQIAVFTRLDDKKMEIKEKPLQIKYQVDYPYFDRFDITNQEILGVVKKESHYLVTDWDNVTRTFTIDELWSLLPIRQYCKYETKLIQVLESVPEFCTVNGTDVTFHFEFKRPVFVPIKNDWHSSSDSEPANDQDDDWGQEYDFTTKEIDIDTSQNCWQ
jgi:2-polyprenyl-3-methyl-5-hydroxy-6-metoxy-1,4-benzoquinol methylase